VAHKKNDARPATRFSACPNRNRLTAYRIPLFPQKNEIVKLKKSSIRMFKNVRAVGNFLTNVQKMVTNGGKMVTKVGKKLMKGGRGKG